MLFEILKYRVDCCLPFVPDLITFCWLVDLLLASRRLGRHANACPSLIKLALNWLQVA